MKLIFRPRSFAALLIVCALTHIATAQAPAPNTTPWEDEVMRLRLFYPSDLVPADAAPLTRDGHLTPFGITVPTGTRFAELAACMRPRLYVALPQTGPSQTTTSTPGPDDTTKVTIHPAPAASILLAELDLDCLNGSQESVSTSLLADMSDLVTNLPGMRPISPSTWYTVGTGTQKVHMAAAQGQPGGDPLSHLRLFTMSISTNWNNHLLVWFFSSNSIDELDRITKTTVRFGRAQAAPLYPLPINNASR